MMPLRIDEHTLQRIANAVSREIVHARIRPFEQYRQSISHNIDYTDARRIVTAVVRELDRNGYDVTRRQAGMFPPATLDTSS